MNEEQDQHGDNTVGDTILGDKVLGDKVFADTYISYDADTEHRVPAGIERPFRDLHAFGLHDQHLFFGRTALIEEGMRKWKAGGKRILAIVGASGSGKSSLAQAGLLPRIAADISHPEQPVMPLIMQPGTFPLQELADALRRAHIPTPGDFATRLFDDPKIFATVLHALAPATLILELDQKPDFWYHVSGNGFLMRRTMVCPSAPPDSIRPPTQRI